MEIEKSTACCSAAPSRPVSEFNWSDKSVWARSAVNTFWCLLGCAIGDLGTIWWFQLYLPNSPVLLVVSLAMINGVLTSIALETIILSRQMQLTLAFKTAIGMSLVSMIAMEAAMNAVDFFLVGGARLVWWVIPWMLLAGFLTPWPYNYWRLKKHGKACH